MKATQQPSKTSNGKKPLFIDASYENNTKSFIKHTQAKDPQSLSINDIGKEIGLLKNDVAKLKYKVQKLEEQNNKENTYKVDLCARQEIKYLKDQLQFPPLEEYFGK